MSEEPRLILAFLLGVGAGTMLVGFLCLLKWPDTEDGG